MIEKNTLQKIAEVFFDQPSRQFHLRELSRLTKLSLPSIITATDKLAQEKIITNAEMSSEQVKKNPIIIIPGFLGSWNKDAILHNKIVLQQDWILNPIAKEYEGLEKTLIHLGYEKNKDFYYFNYDWRKDIESNADKLNVFINNLHLEQPADLVGHSLGGIVGRIYAQKYGKTNIEHLVTVGSPHQGIAKSYMAVEGGEIETDNSLFWLAEKIVLQLYKDGLKTDRQILSENFPVIQNLIPTTDFLKDESQVISISNMAIKNNLLSRYQDNFNQIFDILQTTSGEKGMTTSGYVVKKRNVIDELLDNYPDGRPIQKLTDMGDLTVTSVSAKGGENPIILSKDHGELIYTKDAIKQLLDTLQIGVEDKDIIEGKDGAERMGKWFGMPWEPGFPEREAIYLPVERGFMSADYGLGKILDLTGSAIYIPDQLKRQAKTGLVIHLATSQESMGCRSSAE